MTCCHITTYKFLRITAMAHVQGVARGGECGDAGGQPAAAPLLFSFVVSHVQSHVNLIVLQGVAREVNAAVLEGINASGRAFLIHTELGGQFTMRMAIGAAHTQQRHIDGAWDVIREETERQLARMGDQSVMESAAA